MKSLLTVLLFIIISNSWNISAQITQASVISSGNMTVIVENLDNNVGFVVIALFNSKDAWDGKAKALRGGKEAITNNTASFIFQNIPYGEYALRFFHDEDDDNEMDSNFLGIPSEDYGFSNKAKATFGIPDYEEAKFMFDEANAVVRMQPD